MSRPTFTARTKANPYGVFVINDYEAFQVGTSPTGVAEDSNTNSGNSVIQVRNELFFVGGGVLFQYNKTTTNWDTIYHPIGMHGTTRKCSGLFYVRINNEPCLAWIINTAAATTGFRGIKFNLNTYTATETSATLGAISTTTRHQTFLFGGTVFWHAGGTAIFTYNPGTASLGSPTFTTALGSNFTPAYCVFNKRLYCVSRTGTQTASVFRYNGAQFTLMQSIDTTSNSSTIHGLWAFTDRTNLYFIFPTMTPSVGNHRCWKMDRNESFTDISATVLPSDFLDSVATATKGWVYVDNEDDIDNPNIYIYSCFSSTAGVPVSKWKWNGESSAMTLVGFGGDVSYRWTDDGEGGGHRSYTQNEMDALIQRVEISPTIVGAARITLNAFESSQFPSGTQIEMKLGFDRNFEHISQYATLMNPLPSGTIVNGDTLTGIVVGSGINYSVEWRPSLDGISPGESVRMAPWVSGVI